MPWPEGFEPSHAAPLSRAQVELLEFIARNPEGLRRETFAPVTARDEFMRYDPQVWPVFLGAARRRELERAAAAVSRLVRSLPRRVFGHDAFLMSEFYRIPREQAEGIVRLLETTAIAGTALSRGDFLDTPSGLRCMEVNLCSSLGGWAIPTWLPRFLSVPLLRRFLDETGVRFSFHNPVRQMFGHVAGAARELAEDGRLDMAFLMPGSEMPTDRWMEWFQEEYRAALSTLGLAGGVDACLLDDLTESRGILRLRGRRVHLLLETTMGYLPGPALRAALAGTVRVFNGPATRILNDKLNLALLSEQAGSGLFDPEERRAIETYIPWTRRVAEEFVDWEDERVYLPDLLAERRERLVLKLGDSLGGVDVHIGRSVSAGRWAEMTEMALAQGTWVVQEYLESSPYLFQTSESAAAPHDLVWGLFAYGDTYGGTFLRMSPRGGHGVINAAQGAAPAITLDVE
jgi:hypothetical protein